MPEEIIWFLLAKEFHWTPKDCKDQDAKDIKAMTTILSTYNKVKNAEIERSSKSKSPRGGFSQGGKYIRRETIGPNGIRVEDTPI